MADPSSLLADTGGAIAALPPGADPAVFDHGDGVDTATGLRHVAAQAHALTTKNLLVLLRRKKSTAAYVLMPSLAILSVWAMIVGTAFTANHPFHTWSAGCIRHRLRPSLRRRLRRSVAGARELLS